MKTDIQMKGRKKKIKQRSEYFFHVFHIKKGEKKPFMFDSCRLTSTS